VDFVVCFVLVFDAELRGWAKTFSSCFDGAITCVASLTALAA
jgi:hypothetical protein